MQSELNIGLVGHVDHGKTTLTKTLSGVWTDKHSEEIKRGISIRLGYADCELYKCGSCDEPDCYCTSKKCPQCGSETKFLRKISFVDSPGHETLMATMLSGAAIMDGALLIISANEYCPQPQTAEHLIALDTLDVEHIVIAQNKIDLVSKEDARKNYEQIKKFIQGTVAENAPIIPIAAHYGANIGVLIKAIYHEIPTPKRDFEKDPRMYIARSFDINKPGTQPDKLKGGVIGGSIIHGRFSIGDMIEIKPGVKRRDSYVPLTSEIVALNAGGISVDEAIPGGLIAIGSNLDPYLTKSDNLSGNMIGAPGTLPDVRDELVLDVHLFENLVGDKEKTKIEALKKSEPLMLSVSCATTVGTVIDQKEHRIKLKLPICAESGAKVVISRRFVARWRLIGYGVIR